MAIWDYWDYCKIMEPEQKQLGIFKKKILA